MRSKDIVKKYIDFYTTKEHKLIPNVSLVPENDPTLLFVNSGMFPLVPYLSGEPHPLGTRLVNIQRCVRFEDLPDIGDKSHTLAFHMIGNWSLNDYFKEEQLPWVFEFFIQELKLDPNKIYATVFSGNIHAPKDTSSVMLLQKIFKKYGIDAKEGERIFETEKDNWWKRGDAVGELGGPSAEVFYYIGDHGNGFGKNIIDHENEFLEIGNSVFMQYKKTNTGWEELKQKNVDFGGGLERIALVAQNKRDIFETDNFFPIIQEIVKLSGKKYKENELVTKAMRILADHIRTAVFLAMDGVKPSNKDQGYILRRILRRMIRTGKQLGVNKDISVSLVKITVDTLEWLYPDLVQKQSVIQNVFLQEENKFRITLEKGAREVEKNLVTYGEVNKTAHKSLVPNDAAQIAFELYQSLGYPFEIFIQDVKDKNIDVDEFETEDIFNNLVTEHQNKSRVGAEQKFKGGLGDTSQMSVKYHTTTHLLHKALREVLGMHVEQKGSNITPERLRFDFSHPQKMTEEEKNKVEDLINQKIKEKLPVNSIILPKKDAEETGALHFFGAKYGEQVSIYYIGESLVTAYSKEFCGGPHVSNTNELDEVTIYKQEKLGEGIIRVYLKAKEN